MEETVLTTFCRRSRLLRFVSSAQCPSYLKEAWASIKHRLQLDSLDLSALHGPESSPTKIKADASNLGSLDEDIDQAFTAMLPRNMAQDSSVTP
jgi:hypothetical protein